MESVDSDQDLSEIRKQLLDRRNKFQAWSACAIVACIGLIVLAAIAAADVVTRSTDSAPQADDGIPFKHASHPMQPSTLWGTVEGPYPTGAWWTNLALGKGEMPVAVLPYVVKATEAGLHVSYSAKRRIKTTERLTDFFGSDVIFGSSAPVASRAVLGFDAFSVKYQLTWRSEADGNKGKKDQDSGKDGEGSTASYPAATLTTPLVRGAPYVTVEYRNALPVLSSDSTISTVTSTSEPSQGVDPMCDAHAQCAAIGLSGECCPTSKGQILGCCSQGEASGETFEVHLQNGQTWLLFLNQNLTFAWSSRSIRASNPTDEVRFPLVARVALLSPHHTSTHTAPHATSHATSSVAANGHATLLKKHKNVIPVGGTFSWEILTGSAAAAGEEEEEAGDVGVLRVHWRTASMEDPDPARHDDDQGELATSAPADDLLMTALGHHLDIMKDPEISSPSISFRVMKGDAVTVLGDEWEMRYPLTPITWHASTPIQRNNRAMEGVVNLTGIIAEQARKDVTLVRPSAPDVYGFGKQLGRMARIALIASSVGDNDTTQHAVSILRSAIDAWMTQGKLVYDTTWGGVVSATGLADPGADFGNGLYNDHHFHYSYLLYGFAVAAKFDPEWAASFQNHFTALALDVVNPSEERSTSFPVARHKDFFDGHSWASGLFEQANGKSQESSSEAVNCYYAAHLFALATGDAEIAAFARLLLAMEIHAAQWYWHVSPSRPVYDSEFSEKNKMVGVVGATEVVASTWFGTNIEFVHCINMLPFTPVTQALLPKSYVAEEFPTLARALRRWDDPIAVQWKGFVVQDMAIIDARSAWNQSLLLAHDPTDAVDSGNSYTNMLDWAATRPDFAQSNGTLWRVFRNGSAPPTTPPQPSYGTDDDTTEGTADCADHPQCADLGLVGDCCPASNGLALECC